LKKLLEKEIVRTKVVRTDVALLKQLLFRYKRMATNDNEYTLIINIYISMNNFI
jgi:hypothetical protein